MGGADAADSANVPRVPCHLLAIFPRGAHDNTRLLHTDGATSGDQSGGSGGTSTTALSSVPPPPTPPRPVRGRSEDEPNVAIRRKHLKAGVGNTFDKNAPVSCGRGSSDRSGTVPHPWRRHSVGRPSHRRLAHTRRRHLVPISFPIRFRSPTVRSLQLQMTRAGRDGSSGSWKDRAARVSRRARRFRC
jgi:hypothetical protein